MDTTATNRLANRLVTIYSDLLDINDDPKVTNKAKQIAAARFAGACEAAQAMGFGLTPTAVHSAVSDAVHAHGPRPAPTAYMGLRKVWLQSTVGDVLDALLVLAAA